jgi:hypothetical protein
MKSGAFLVVTGMKRIPGLVLTALLLCAAVRATTPTLSVSEIHSGQRGYGLSDFGDGRGVQKFDVEILGVLKEYAPRQDLILARLSGQKLEESGIIAGMSGSPVYIDGKLIGAVAYGWPFAREPIAGITPIAAMLDIRHVPPGPPVPIGAQGATREKAASLLSAAAEGDFRPMFQGLLDRAFPAAAPDSWARLPLPVSSSGFGGSFGLVSRLFQRDGFVEAPAAGKASGEVPPLEPGSSVSTILVSGDMSLAASGTVTWIEGENVLAFGHPFLSMGPVEMPMASSQVIGVLPSIYRSFKFAAAGRVLGSITQDRSTGILGSFGTKAKMVPVDLSVASEDVPIQRYHFDVVRNSMLTPILTGLAIDSVLTTLEKSAGERTLVMKSVILTPDRTVHFDAVYSGLSAKDQAVSSMAVLTNYLMANEFHDLSIDGIRLTFEHSDILKNARITDVEPEKEKAHAGETVKVRVGLQDFRGGSRRLSIDVPIPLETPPGPLTIFVGDGNAATAYDFSMFPPDPRSLDQVLDMLDRMRPANTVNLLAYRAGSGATIAGQELSGLPPSVFTVFAAHSALESIPDLANRRVFARSVEQPIPLSGSAKFMLEVVPKID